MSTAQCFCCYYSSMVASFFHRKHCSSFIIPFSYFFLSMCACVASNFANTINIVLHSFDAFNYAFHLKPFVPIFNVFGLYVFHNVHISFFSCCHLLLIYKIQKSFQLDKKSFNTKSLLPSRKNAAEYRLHRTFTVWGVWPWSN